MTNRGNFLLGRCPFTFVLLSLFAAPALRAQTVDSFDPHANDGVIALAVQPDGKVLLGGYFSAVNYQFHGGLARVSADGVLDWSFPSADGVVTALTLQPDGRVLVGGRFGDVGSVSRANIARVNPDGSVDPSFNPGSASGVECVAIQGDGKILVAFRSGTIAGAPRSFLARLNADGTIDAGFNPSADRYIWSVGVQTNGQIVVGGWFTALAGQPRSYLGRLNSDGALDAAFTNGIGGVQFPSIDCVLVQADGKIVVGGLFTTLGALARTNIGRLNADGSVDATFNPGADGEVFSLVQQTDGKIVAAGWFGMLGGQVCTNVGRLNANGTLDTAFNGSVSGQAESLALQADGKLLVAGWINGVGGQPRSCIARLNNTGAATQSLSKSGSAVTWQRGGTSPEVWRTTFEYSADGVNWTSLGAGTRIAGGWQVSAGSLPPKYTLRAHGYFQSGYYNGSGGMVETVSGALAISQQPTSRTNNAATLANFSVLAGGGSSTNRYQWCRAGTNLTDGGNISGANTALLSISYVLGADAAAYSVVITNGSESLTSQTAQLAVIDPVINAQPVSQWASNGQVISFSVLAAGTAPTYQWRWNGTNVAWGTASTLAVTNLPPGAGGSYDVVVTSPFGNVTSTPALLGTTDPFNPTVNGSVHCLVVQPNGKLVLGGTFTSVGGQPRTNLARVNADGTLDTVFNPGADNDVYALALQLDGKLLVGGNFANLAGQARSYLGRLNLDGSLDGTFTPVENSMVFGLAVQTNGMMLVSGWFTTLAGESCNRFGRLRPDGTRDSTFNSSPDSAVGSIAVQADGKIVIGGAFSNVGGQARNRLARLNADGTADTSFVDPQVWNGVGAVAVQPDGKVLIGGNVNNLGGVPRNWVARVNADGTLDTGWDAGLIGGPVNSIVVQTDGRILLGGSFYSVAGQTRNNLVRLWNDGTLDTTFNPGANGAIECLTLQPDGQVVAAGGFTVLGGESRARLGRLNPTQSATNGLSLNGSAVTWLRGAAAPEAPLTTFAASTNNADWFPLGVGTRIAGGWQLLGVSLPASATIRARAPVIGDSHASSWYCETVIGPPVIDTQPMSMTNFAGASGGFVANAVGSSPLRFQWVKDGVPLADGGNVSGSQTLRLALSNLSGADRGGYSLVASNAFGSVTSLVARLEVIDPFFALQPASLTNNATSNATFTVAGMGGAPLAYRWLKNGAPLADGGNVSGTQTPTLVLTNVLGADAGQYQAVLSNAWGSATSVVATLTVIDPLLISQPVGQKVNAGGTALFSLTAIGTLPLACQWYKDGIPSGTTFALALTNVQPADAGLYQAVVTNLFGAVTSSAVRLDVNLAIADAFNPGANATVRALALQGDGAILVGGQFTNLAGQAQSRIGRLLADGTLDTSFFTSADDTVWSLAVQADGRPLAGGDFMNFSGQPTRRLGRLNLPGGGADGGFNPWPNNTVRCVVEQPDGLILVGGLFDYISFNSQSNLARLQAGSWLDTSFTPALNGPVYALALQPDGKILVGGGFTTVNTLPRRGLVRLNPDGSVDAGFTASLGTAYNGAAYALLVQKDGLIVVGGQFDSANGQACANLARLNPDGSPDPAFSAAFAGALDGAVFALSLQADSKIIVGGTFPNIFGQSRSGIARLYPDGSLDPYYFPGQGLPSILAQALQTDGKLVVGGWFTTMGGQPRNKIARLNPPEPATNALTFDNVSINWQRGGSATEVWRTTFDYTTNGSAWVALGEGSRTPGGWQLTGLSLPASAIVRARGFVCGGSWFVESRAGPPLLLSQPYSLTYNVTWTATFSVAGNGGSPLSYQWLKNGAPLSDGGNLWGSQTPTLTVTNIFGADAGQYQAVLSNAWGSVTSVVATLTVIDPVITGQSGNQSVSPGQNASFSVTAIGTPPLQYQWLRNGTPLDSATNSSLALTNVQASDAAYYSAVVSNAFGSRTSVVVGLTVNLAVPDAFNPGSRTTVPQLLLQPDGKILVSSLFGLANNPRYLARFNPDGSLDPGFLYTNMVGDGSAPGCLALQTDGRILGSGLGRLQASWTFFRLYGNGLLDISFTNALSGSVYGLALRPDGQVWAGGYFSLGKPSILTNLALVQTNGAVDTNVLEAVNGTVYALALQPDGKLLAGGSFTTANGVPATRLARFTATGVLDTDFNASANNTVLCLLVQPDARILVAGSFTTLDGATVNRVGRLNPDGTLDAGFNPNVNSPVYSMALQADGKIVIAGAFGAVSGQPRNRLARLNADGSLDLTFNPNVNNQVYAVGIQADGAVVVAGGFSTITGQYRTNLARLAATDPATQALSYDGANLNWARGGTSPEVWRTTFEMSTNGADWVYLGAGERVAGGWRLTGVSLPAQANARARGFVTGGQNNGASWFVESSLGPALLTSQPAGRTNLAGTTANFWVSGGGTAPLSYQWLKAGQPLSDGGNISGSTTPTLTLSNVFGGDAAAYAVIVSNAGGSVTSSVAYLSVIEPIITSQPVSVYTNAGQAVSFSVTALGTLPAYQWRKNGTNIAGATGTSFVLASAQKDDIAGYRAVVTTAYGAATSSVANLTLNLALTDDLSPALNDEVRSLALQPDGKIFIGGNFNQIGGQWFYEFGRLNADGTQDTTFPGHANSAADTVAVQPDGNILVGGWFDYLNDWPHSCIGRFYPDGSLDPAVNPSFTSSPFSPFVDSLVPQPDGKFLIGGWFTGIAGQTRNYIGRFNANGTLDTFNPGANTHVMVLALQPDGKIIASGNFTTLGGQTRNRIGRLNSDGTLDTSFDPNANSTVNSLVLQPDGKILAAGSFTSIAGQTRSYLVRLNIDGTLDTTFNANLNGGVTGIALQADGSVVLAGGFTTVGGQARTGLARVSSTGVVDPYWSPQVAGGGVGGVAIQPDGKILLAGSFTSINGLTRSRLARVDGLTPANHSLTCDANGVTWSRGGASPEIFGTTFETSSDGTNWTSLGTAARIAGGWRVNTASLALNSYVRARGFASGGRWNGSLGLIEEVTQVSTATAPVIVSGDSSFGFHTNQFGFTVRALPGQVIVVEATTNFVDWVPLQTNLVGSLAQFVFTDSRSSGLPRRFYRARAYTGPLPPPAISADGSAGFQSGLFGFNLSGVVGQTVVLEGTTNLASASWTALSTNTLGPGSLYFTDPDSTNYSSRFYRARWP